MAPAMLPVDHRIRTPAEPATIPTDKIILGEKKSVAYPIKNLKGTPIPMVRLHKTVAMEEPIP